MKVPSGDYSESAFREFPQELLLENPPGVQQGIFPRVPIRDSSRTFLWKYFSGVSFIDFFESSFRKVLQKLPLGIFPGIPSRCSLKKFNIQISSEVTFAKSFRKSLWRFFQEILLVNPPGFQSEYFNRGFCSSRSFL